MTFFSHPRWWKNQQRWGEQAHFVRVILRLRLILILIRTSRMEKKIDSVSMTGWNSTNRLFLHRNDMILDSLVNIFTRSIALYSPTIPMYSPTRSSKNVMWMQNLRVLHWLAHISHQNIESLSVLWWEYEFCRLNTSLRQFSSNVQRIANRISLSFSERFAVVIELETYGVSKALPRLCFSISAFCYLYLCLPWFPWIFWSILWWNSHSSLPFRWSRVQRILQFRVMIIAVFVALSRSGSFPDRL